MAIKLLEGKVAAITGGLTGIGRAIAIAYIRNGASVAVNHLGSTNETSLVEALQSEAATLVSGGESRLITVAGDISQPETGKKLVQKTVEKWGRLDIFVSNAGICKFEEFLKLEPSLFNATITTNLSGAFFAVQAAATQMSSQSPSGGSIIAISSISALVGGGLQTHYTPTKAGVLSLMQSCAVALGKYNIRCNALLPGTIRTQLNDEDLSDEGKRTYMEGRIPLGRLGQPEDLAGPAVWLGCDELSGYVTGSSVLVDGGLFVNLQ